MTMLIHHKLAVGSCLALLFMTTGCQSSATPEVEITETETKPVTSNSGQNNEASVPVNIPIKASEKNPIKPSVKPQTSQQILTQQALDIQQALATKDYASITNHIHPTRGVRFSMYAYVHLNKDKVFSREQFVQYLNQSKVRFTWGELDGVGEALVVPLPEYLDTWIDGKKYNNARITVNTFESRGNMINNVNEAYPKSDVVDFYYKGSDEYDGIDWRGMRLVFDDYQGKRYLVGIINDRWTV